MLKINDSVCILFIVFWSVIADADASLSWVGIFNTDDYEVRIRRDSPQQDHIIDVYDKQGNLKITTSAICGSGFVQALLGIYSWQEWLFLFGEVEEKYALGEILYFNLTKPHLTGCVMGHYPSFSPSKNRVAYSKFVPRTLLKEADLWQVFIHDFSRDDYVLQYPPQEWAEDHGPLIHKEGVILQFDEEPGLEYKIGNRLQYFPPGAATDMKERWTYREPRLAFIWSDCSNRLAFLSRCIKENYSRCGIWLTIIDFDDSQEKPCLTRHLLSFNMCAPDFSGDEYNDLIWMDDERLLLIDINKNTYTISVNGEVKSDNMQEQVLKVQTAQ